MLSNEDLKSASVLLLAAAVSEIVVPVTSLGYAAHLSRNVHLLPRGQELVQEEAEQEKQK